MTTDPRLVADALLGILSAALFAYVGRLNRIRAAGSEDAHRALGQFATWWQGLAAYTLVGAVRSALGAWGFLDIRVHVALEALGYAPLFLALWGLLGYLVFIYAGTHRWQPLLKGYHAALFVAFVLLLAWTRPYAVDATGWRTSLLYEHPLQGPVLALAVFAILGPVILAALGYAGLYARTRDARARRRVALVSVSLVLWFGLSALSRATVSPAVWWPLATRLLGLGATLLLLLAFREPSVR